MQINIAGAGISGLTSAINLAKNGYKVNVYEKNKDVGMRHHGDFQGIANWMMKKDILLLLKEMNIEKFPYYELKDVDLYAYKELIEIKSKIPLAYLVKRGGENSLDFSLKNLAIENKVNIYFNSKADDCQIIATGPKKVSGIAVGIRFQSGSDDKKMLIVDDNLTGKGYAYMFIINGEGTISTVFFEDFERAKTCLQKTISAFKKITDFDIKNEKKFGGFGYFNIPKTAIENGKLLVGENAGFQDKLFGYGMIYAFLSGYFSAASIIENKNYDELWKNSFLKEMKTSVVNRYVLRKLGNNNYGKYFGKWKNKDVLNELYKIYSPSLWKSLVYFIVKGKV